MEINVIEGYKLPTMKGLDFLRLLTKSLKEEDDNSDKLSEGLLRDTHNEIDGVITLFRQVNPNEKAKSNTKQDQMYNYIETLTSRQLTGF